LHTAFKKGHWSVEKGTEERTSILFQLIKLREVFGTSTVVTCQYPADDWGDFMGEQNEPALSDAIRRRLTSGFILNIETA